MHTFGRRSLLGMVAGAAASCIALSGPAAAEPRFRWEPALDGRTRAKYRYDKARRTLVADGQPSIMVDETDYTAMDGNKLVEVLRDDGAKWAAAFCQYAAKKGIVIDEGWMIAWFANAIECSHAVRMEKPRKHFRDAIDIQSMSGNWNCNGYMHGFLNGIIYGESLIGDLEPKYAKAPADGYLDDRPHIASKVRASEASGTRV